MRIGTDERVWVVTDPRRASEFGDIFSEASLRVHRGACWFMWRLFEETLWW